MQLYGEESRKRQEMDSQSCDWILQCLKNNMDKTGKTSPSVAPSVSSSSVVSSSTRGAPLGTAPSTSTDEGGPSSPKELSPSPRSPHTAPSPPTGTSRPSSNSSAAGLVAFKKTDTLAYPCKENNGQSSANNSGSSSPVTSITHRTSPHHRSSTPEVGPYTSVGGGGATISVVGSCRPSAATRDSPITTSAAGVTDPSTLEDISVDGDTSAVAMKQERDESPLMETTGLSKALSIASCNSALANAVFSLSRLSAAAAGSSSMAPVAGMSAADLDATKQQIARMLQGLPYMFPGIQRLPGPALQPGLTLPPGGSAAVAPTAGPVGLKCVCGISFTCRGNMEAHKKFYCTHGLSSSSDGANDSIGSREAIEAAEENSWGMLKCPQCPYTTTHKLSLNGHMNMHTSPSEDAHPVTSPAIKPPTIDPKAAERYCTECDIQFSSMKTFRVHKAHYCQTRHVLKANKSPVRDEPPPTAASLMNNNCAGQPILLLPTDPVLLVPYSVLIGASLLPSHILPQQNAAVLTADGQIQPLSLAHLLAHSQNASAPPMLSPNFNVTASVPTLPTSIHPSNPSPQISPRTVPCSEAPATHKIHKVETSSVSADRKRRGDGDSPLDLTTKRSKLSLKTDLLSDEEKENREVNTPSLTNSPAAARNGTSSESISGEFEGKLLAASPLTSPANDEADRSTPRSPRPASAAPSLTSPRAPPQDSPRASTSTANRSPSQASPSLPQSLLPPIPAGFPGLLSGLDSLSSLPFANLQYLQSLQGVSPDILLKMFNGMVPTVAPPPSTPIKQGEALCKECNITFYKEENYLVHKKHYCAAREKSNEEDRQSAGRQSPATSRSSLSPPSRIAKSEAVASASNVSREPSKTVKPIGQFTCGPCGIKFTSPDNLGAHQTYYCPKREGVSEEGVTKGMWRCPRCRVAMPESMQAGHQCVTVGNSSAHGWKCPCCPMLSPTAAAAQKHLETHAGIKAFKCTVCGYRGNTLRGMRTHIRMHFDKRTNDIQEENFIECILENDDRRLRLTNSQDLRMNLLEYPQSLMDNPALAAAILSSGGAPMSETTDPPLSCTICPYVTPHRSSFIKHLHVVHKLGVELKNFLEKQTIGPLPSHPPNNSRESPQNAPSESATNSPPLATVKLEPEVKLEVTDVEEDTPEPAKSPGSLQDKGGRTSRSSPPSRSPLSPGMAALSSGGLLPSSSGVQEAAHHCHVCNISFSFIDSYLAHKKFYCTRQQSSTPPETTVQ